MDDAHALRVPWTTVGAAVFVPDQGGVVDFWVCEARSPAMAEAIAHHHNINLERQTITT